MKVYLCGAINGCTDEECKDWREAAKSRLYNVTCIDPMRNDYRGKENSEYRKIVETDKWDIYASDIVLVNYEKPSVGTAMEVYLAWQLGKFVVLVSRDGTVISPWLRYHTHLMFNSFEDVFNILNTVASVDELWAEHYIAW